MKLFKRIAAVMTVAVLIASAGALAACTPATPNTPDPGPDDDPVDQTATYTVTFDYNYEGSTATTAQVKEGEKVAKPADPTRDGYDFDDWYVDADFSATFDFDTAITESVTLYAQWYDSSVVYHTVTYDLNYEGSESTTKKVADNTRLATGAAPVRDGYSFVDWYKDAACTEKFSFVTKITEDITLYARWATQYVFEAEHTYLRDKIGPSSSGEGSYLDMLYEDTLGLGASNGYAVTYLYAKDGDNGKYKTTLTFYIDSDQAVNDATIYIRLSAELASITLNGEEYQVIVNGVTYNYDTVELNIVDRNTPADFRDVFVSDSVKLVEGTNTIQLKVSNSEKPIGGTTYAKAPLVDCIKISTDATLAWTAEYNGIKYPVRNDTAKENI